VPAEAVGTLSAPEPPFEAHKRGDAGTALPETTIIPETSSSAVEVVEKCLFAVWAFPQHGRIALPLLTGGR
jgi:hypothetical protein